MKCVFEGINSGSKKICQTVTVQGACRRWGEMRRGASTQAPPPTPLTLAAVPCWGSRHRANSPALTIWRILLLVDWRHFFCQPSHPLWFLFSLNSSSSLVAGREGLGSSETFPRPWSLGVPQWLEWCHTVLCSPGPFTWCLQHFPKEDYFYKTNKKVWLLKSSPIGYSNYSFPFQATFSVLPNISDFAIQGLCQYTSVVCLHA